MTHESPRTCSVDGCDSPHFGRGWCNKHYRRWQRHGDPSVIGSPQRKLPIRKRIEGRLSKSGECHIWMGSISDGYGYVSVNGSMKPVHRVVWELEHGPIPDGALLDHTCRNRACANVAHLRIATNKQNLENLRGANTNSKTGIRGVCWHKKSRKWVAQVGHNNQKYYLGMFDRVEDAEKAALDVRRELFTHNDMDRKSA